MSNGIAVCHQMQGLNQERELMVVVLLVYRLDASLRCQQQDLDQGNDLMTVPGFLCWRALPMRVVRSEI